MQHPKINIGTVTGVPKTPLITGRSGLFFAGVTMFFPRL